MYFIINIIILCKFVLTLTIKTCILWYKSVLKMYYITHVIRHRCVHKIIIFIEGFCLYVFILIIKQEVILRVIILTA